MFFFFFFVSTPIGNLQDISIRAIEILKNVDIVLCEDTRISTRLFQKFDIKTPLMVYNDHNAVQTISKVIDLMLHQNKVFALISDAGTPLISDPGYKLVNACIKNNLSYTVIPGASAAISALILSGLPSNKFLFAGFVDITKFSDLAKVNATLIFYEAPNRILNTLCQMREIFKNRTIAVVKEITKIHETTIRGQFSDVIAYFTTNPAKGEFVILLSPPSISEIDKLNELNPLIAMLINKISKKDLSNILAKYSGISKNMLYNYLMENYND